MSDIISYFLNEVLSQDERNKLNDVLITKDNEFNKLTKLKQQELGNDHISFVNDTASARILSADGQSIIIVNQTTFENLNDFIRNHQADKYHSMLTILEEIYHHKVYCLMYYLYKDKYFGNSIDGYYYRIFTEILSKINKLNYVKKKYSEVWEEINIKFIYNLKEAEKKAIDYFSNDTDITNKMYFLYSQIIEPIVEIITSNYLHSRNIIMNDDLQNNTKPIVETIWGMVSITGCNIDKAVKKYVKIRKYIKKKIGTILEILRV